MRECKIVISLLIALSFPSLATPLVLGPRSFSSSLELFFNDDLGRDFNNRLSSQQRAWLSQQQEISVGIVGPLTPPFELLTSKKNFEGMGADLLSIFSLMAGVNIKLNLYENESKALSAIKDNRVQMLGINSILPKLEQKKLLSGMFSNELIPSSRVYLAGRRGGQLADIESATMAYELESFDINMLRELYPKATLIGYETASLAFDSVLLGHADYFIGSRSVGRYLNGGRFGNLAALKVLDVKNKPLSFFVGESNKHLLDILNVFIDVLKEHRVYGTLDLRWRGGMGSELLVPSDYLVSAVYNDLKERKLRVGLIKNNLPFSFLNNNGQWQGMIISMLDYISLQTGLTFVEVAYDRFDEAERGLLNNEVDIISSLASHVPNGVYLTSLYYNADDVLVEVAADNLPKHGDSLYAAVSSNREEINNSLLSRDVGNKFIYFDTDFDVLRQLESGLINKAVVSLYSAEYYRKLSSRSYSIIKKINNDSIERVFSVRNDDVSLLKIIDASLALSLPSHLSNIAYQWRYGPKPEMGIYAQYGHIIKPLMVVVIPCLLIYFYYSYRLARALKYRKKAEVKLLSQLDMMQQFIDGIPHPVVLLGSNLCIKFRNRSFNKAFGITVDADVIFLDSLISEEDCDGVLKTINSAFCFDNVLTRETSIKILDKSKDIQDWFIPYDDVNDDSRGVFWGWFDVTWRNDAYTTAIHAKAEAEQANQAKSEFISTISHEIRTPLNIINGFLEIFSSSQSISMSEREELNYMRSASQNLLELVGDVLDVTKIESGLLTIENEAVDIYTLLRNSADMFYLMASKKGVKIFEEYQLDSSSWFILDPLRVRQVFYNVLSNAVKFTDAGMIKILVRFVDGTLHVRVTDTGIGISEEKLGCLFKPFIQAHTDKSYTGSGLGLNISKRLCELMGGGISMSSVRGEGTIVEFYLPCARVAPSKKIGKIRDVTPHEKCGVTNIVIVDDHPINLILLDKQLKSLGYSVIKAETARNVIDILKFQSVDAVLTDCQMPDIDGFELAQMIRHAEEQGELPRRHVIIGLTASGLEQDRSKALQSGMDGCLFKPIDRSRLQKAFEPYLESICHQDTEFHVKQQKTENAQLLKLVHDTSMQDLSAAYQALEEHDYERVSSLVHRIKGVYLMFKINEVVSLCEQIERDVIDGLDMDLIYRNFQGIEKIINKEKSIY